MGMFTWWDSFPYFHFPTYQIHYSLHLYLENLEIPNQKPNFHFHPSPPLPQQKQKQPPPLSGVWYGRIHITPDIQIPRNVILRNHILRNAAIPMFGLFPGILNELFIFPILSLDLNMNYQVL